MKRVVRELAIMGLMGEDVSHVSKKASEICYKNMARKGHTDYMKKDKDTDKEKERVS